MALSKEELEPKFEIVSDIKSGMYSVCNQGYVINNKTGKTLKPYLNNKRRGYVYVKLQDGKKSRSFHVGVLVGKAFVPNPENKKTVNHEDGNKQNNHYTNINWNTYKENSQHAFTTGLGKSGFNHYSSRFCQEDFWEIKDLHQRGLKNFEIARLYNVSETAVRNLVLGVTYKYIEVPKFDLLAPRFKVKIKYPFSSFKVGDIITTGRNSYLYRNLIEYPEIFSRLEWWEERAIDDLPKFVKDDEHVYKVTEWHTDIAPKCSVAIDVTIHKNYIRNCDDMPLYGDYIPATEEEYNTQSTQQ